MGESTIHVPTLAQNSAHRWHLVDSWSGKCEEIAPFMHTDVLMPSCITMMKRQKVQQDSEGNSKRAPKS